MPWSKVILWVILLAIGLMAYVTDTQLAPMDYPPQLRRGAPALMFKKHLLFGTAHPPISGAK
jgi:hypothetical protein